MAYFLDRVDAVPIANNDIDPQFAQWLWVLVDVLNENLSDIENALNLLTAVGHTQAEITSMNAAGELSNGVIIYDITNNVYVGRIAGTLVKFTTAAYP